MQEINGPQRDTREKTSCNISTKHEQNLSKSLEIMRSRSTRGMGMVLCNSFLPISIIIPNMDKMHQRAWK